MLTLRRSLVPLVLFLSAACGGGGTEPPAPAAVVATTGNPLASVVVGSVIAGAGSFEVRSSNGTALAGIAVSVTVTAGGGQLAGAPTVSLAGPTSIGQWTLGTTSGTQSVTVTVAGVTPLVFTVVAQAGPAASLAKEDGDGQYGTELTATFAPLRVRVRDAFANPVGGASVAWTIDGGGGSLAGATSLSDASGIAAAPTWTLGAIAGGQQAVLATLGGLTTRFTAIAQLAPASLTVETPAPASATVFALLAPAPSFAVRDINGTALAGIPVTVALTAGNGQLTAAPVVTVAGPTSIGTWRLGTIAGVQSVTVTVPGFAPQVFSVASTPDVPALITLTQGGNQVALAGAMVPITPAVKVTDQYGNGLNALTVQWAITSGGGVLGGSTSTVTNASGQSTGPTWTLGTRGGTQSLSATSSGLLVPIAAFIQTAYDIDLRFIGTAPTGAVGLAFQSAVSRITAMVIGDVPSVLLSNINLSDCNSALTGQPAINETVDDVVIYASVGVIDGVGGTLGNAGPCLIRNVGGLTALGTMRFDIADLDNLAAQGRLADVIFHEMLHVIGVGTLWESRGLLLGKDSATVRMTGPLATAACVNDIGGAAVCLGSVPAENCLDLVQACGVGTRNSHWKESIFKNELMTGYTSGVTNPLSIMSVQSLGDLGYVVNVLTADAYTVPPAALMAPVVAGGAVALELPAPLLPRFTVDRGGRVRRIVR
jgi:hypothetical protein